MTLRVDAAQSGVPAEHLVENLDLIPVAGYAWTAATAFCSNPRHQDPFAKETRLKILEVQVDSVIRSLRCLATRRGLSGTKRKDVDRVCGDFSAHRHRLQYDEHLAQGYPIATGVIDSACRHRVKNRMDRSD